MSKTKRSTGKKIELSIKAFLIILMAVYCISLLIPLYWMIANSFKSYTEYYSNTFGLPQKFVFNNYPSVLSLLKITVFIDGSKVQYGIDMMLFYSFVWSFFGTAFGVLVVTLVAYVMSRYNFFGRDFIFAVGIFIMVVPIIGSFPSAMIFAKKIGTYNNMLLMILTGPSAAFSGFTFLLLYGAFKRIPWSYAEAVFIDGGGHFTAMIKVMLPMMLPTCVVLFVLGFIDSWNNYQTFLIWLPSYPNLALGIYLFQQNASVLKATVPQIMAGFVIIIIPTVIIYMSAQKLIMTKFTIGGLKG